MARIVAVLVDGPENGTYWSVDENQQVIYGLNGMEVPMKDEQGTDEDGNAVTIQVPDLEADGFPKERYTRTGELRDLTAEELEAGWGINGETSVSEFTYGN